MREHAVVARCAIQTRQHRADPVDGIVVRDPATLDSHNDRHGAESRAADGDEIVPGIAGRLLPIPRKPADRVGALPEEAKCLPLDQIEEILIGFGEAAGKGICWGTHGKFASAF